MTKFYHSKNIMIDQYITKDRIMLNLEVSDWHELVDEVGQLMLELGDIEPSYIDAMKKIIEDLGPYAVIAPGIVLLHARPESGVKRISLVVATLKDGINFGSKNDPVKLAFGLGAVDHKGHVDLLRDLSLILQDKEKISKLLKINDKEEFLRIFCS